MRWHNKKQPGPAANESEDQLRAQLIEACRHVRRRIEVQQTVQYSRTGGLGGDAIAVQALQTELDQLEESLASLGPNNA
jgi:hypothetical protein